MYVQSKYAAEQSTRFRLLIYVMQRRLQRWGGGWRPDSERQYGAKPHE